MIFVWDYNYVLHIPYFIFVVYAHPAVSEFRLQPEYVSEVRLQRGVRKQRE